MMKLTRLTGIFAAVVLMAHSAYAQGAAPQGLTSSVAGTTVTLTWNAPPGGAGSYVVEASLVPGGLAVATLPVAGTSLTVPNVPSGNYYVRVRAITGGGLSAASNEVLVSVSSGCPGPPLPPAVIVRSVGSQATVTWGPSGGCAPTSYTLFAGSAPGLSNITVVNAGAGLGLGAIAPPGIYYVRVLGTNAYGSAMSEEFIVRVAPNALTDTVASGGAVALDIQVSQSGAYQAALVWNDATIDLDLYLTTAGCPYPPSGCLLAISDGTGGNSEQVTRPVVAGETYRLWIDNFSPRTTSFTIYNTISGAPLPVADEASSDERAAAAVRKQKP